MDTRVEKYLDGELDAASIERLMVDAKHDPDLKRELAAAQRLRSTFRSLPRYALPPAATQRVMAKVRSSPANRPPRRRAMRIAVPAAAACIVFLLVVGIRWSAPDPEPAPTAVEVQRALHDVQFAFALVADVSQRTGEAIRMEILDIPIDKKEASTASHPQSSQQESSP